MMLEDQSQNKMGTTKLPDRFKEPNKEIKISPCVEAGTVRTKSDCDKTTVSSSGRRNVQYLRYKRNY